MDKKMLTYHILFIEPEERLREIVTKLLELEGAEVTAVNDLSTAKEILTKLPVALRDFNVVVIDRENYRDKNYEKEIRCIRGLNQRAKFIATTGYLDDPILNGTHNNIFNKIIMKPYAASDLAAC